MSLRKPGEPNPYLIGNGHWCSCCFPDGPPTPIWNYRRHLKKRRGCNECAGSGRVVVSVERLLAEATARNGRRAA